ncbi:unnamed protein product [Adineta steineri]|uniref:Uncharacterized protein n=1 Tax=Adineta steineri TaxID=433720 RepID=A0A819NVS8_9BILA|nr:unnamed protein product [Adineta steineri]CAF4002901.1 unnamed protein product [Adineta steineri]
MDLDCVYQKASALQSKTTKISHDDVRTGVTYITQCAHNILSVHFILAGEEDETTVRTFSDPHRKILQRGAIDAFIMVVPKYYIRIWHDNSGQCDKTLWFIDNAKILFYMSTMISIGITVEILSFVPTEYLDDNDDFVLNHNEEYIHRLNKGELA